MTQGRGGLSPVNIQAHLKGAHYPSSKKDLLATAKHNGASREILKLLERMPEEEFAGPQEVMKACAEVEGEGESESPPKSQAEPKSEPRARGEHRKAG